MPTDYHVHAFGSPTDDARVPPQGVLHILDYLARAWEEIGHIPDAEVTNFLDFARRKLAENPVVRLDLTRGAGALILKDDTVICVGDPPRSDSTTPADFYQPVFGSL